MSKNLTIDGDSDYALGTQDTQTPLSDGESGSEIIAENINGLAKFAVQLQALLGRGPDLKGSVASLVARLATVIAAGGGLANGTVFPAVPPPTDGQPFYRTDLNLLYIFEGVSQTWILPQPAVADHHVLVNLLLDDHPQYVLTDGTRIITGDQEIKKAVPTFRIRGTELSAQEFGFQESAGLLTVVKNTGSEGSPIYTPAQPIWWPIIGPTGTGPGSTYTLEPATTWASNAAFSGLHIFNGALVLNAGVTITISAGGGALVIISTASIAILGTINGAGSGCPGGKGGYGLPGGLDPVNPSSSGEAGITGTGQPGGGGGGADLMTGGVGGGVRAAPGGARGQAAGSVGSVGSNGGSASQITGSNLALGFGTYVFYGGGGGGGGGGGAHEDTNHGPGGDGGDGGADIVLIAPVVTLGLGAHLTTSGTPGIINGGVTQDGNTRAGSGGGGGAGNVWVYANTFIDNGAVFAQVGGTGGTGGGGHGGAGAAGLKQIFLFNNPLQFR